MLAARREPKKPGESPIRSLPNMRKVPPPPPDPSTADRAGVGGRTDRRFSGGNDAMSSAGSGSGRISFCALSVIEWRRTLSKWKAGLVPPPQPRAGRFGAGAESEECPACQGLVGRQRDGRGTISLDPGARTDRAWMAGPRRLVAARPGILRPRRMCWARRAAAGAPSRTEPDAASTVLPMSRWKCRRRSLRASYCRCSMAWRSKRHYRM